MKLSTIIGAFALACIFCSCTTKFNEGDDVSDMFEEDQDEMTLDEADTVDSEEDAFVEEEAPLPCGNGIVDEGEECDDDNEVEGDGCDNDCTYSCHNNSECNDGHDCTSDACEMTTHICSHLLDSSDIPCRPATGDCDVVEFCDGANADCPTDVLEAVDTPCEHEDYCITEDHCDGSGLCVGTSADKLFGVQDVSAGGFHTCIIVVTGGVRCWGRNQEGQIGDGTTDERHAPVPVAGLSSGVIAIASGSYHTCALLNAHTVKCWGRNDYGALGDGTTTTRTTPTDVSGLSGVEAISAGVDFSCALLSSGDVKCWGRNDEGRLGDGTLTNRLTPVTVSALSGVTAISCGDGHACVLLDSGGVSCWGDNMYGQLGQEPSVPTYSTTPVDVAEISSGALEVSAGGDHSCARLSTGELKCWGRNSSGQLGDGTIISSATPVLVSGISETINISGGENFTCTVLVSKRVMCWGRNDSGQLGDGSTDDRWTPVEVALLTNAEYISAGSGHTCAIRDTEDIRCWGNNQLGQLGDGSSDNYRSEIVEVLCSD